MDTFERSKDRQITSDVLLRKLVSVCAKESWRQQEARAAEESRNMSKHRRWQPAVRGRLLLTPESRPTVLSQLLVSERELYSGKADSSVDSLDLTLLSCDNRA